tara:strand:- start:2603 stop:3094 length:492 start_codon:yes stop_codon:yes gene_type:complete
MNVKEALQLLDIQEVTTSRQKKNGTREFKLPVKDQYGGEIHVASFASGYVRRTKAGGYCPSWQLNKRVESEPQYYGPFENGMYRKYTTRTCKLILDEQERLEYLISFCLKNYYIGQANRLSSGEFIPKWKHEDEIKRTKELHVWQEEPEVKVIINGHRYNITP